MALVAGLALINATGVYAQLVAAQVGRRGEATAAVETQCAALAVRIEVQGKRVADLDRRLGQIDTAIEEAAKRGRRKRRSLGSKASPKGEPTSWRSGNGRRAPWQPCKPSAPQ